MYDKNMSEDRKKYLRKIRKNKNICYFNSITYPDYIYNRVGITC